jgi:hypothetical protein
LLATNAATRHVCVCTWHILDGCQHHSNRLKTYIYKTNLKTVDRKTTGFSLIAILVCLCDHGRCLLFHTPYVCVLEGDFCVINNLVGGGILPDISTIERLSFDKHETKGVSHVQMWVYSPPTVQIGRLEPTMAFP